MTVVLGLDRPETRHRWAPGLANYFSVTGTSIVDAV
jgi:hypothetical protein